MMTDEQMQQRLQLLGEQWRAEHGNPAAVRMDDLADDVTVTASDGSRVGGRWPIPRLSASRWVAAGAALAAIAAVVAIAVVVRPSGPTAVPMTTPSSAAATTSSTHNVVPSVLTGQVWDLVSANGISSGLPTQTMGIAADGTVDVSYRCAEWRGSGQFSEDSATGNGTGSIRKGVTVPHRCPDVPGLPPTDNEATIDQILDGSLTWFVTGTDPSTLTILDSDGSGRNLTYSAGVRGVPVTAMPGPLLGTWNLTDANGVAAHNHQTVEFLVNGTVLLSYGCGSWIGTVQSDVGPSRMPGSAAEATTLIITKGSTQQQPCPQVLNSASVVRAEIDKVLPGTVSWTVAGPTLTITRIGGGTLSFTR